MPKLTPVDFDPFADDAPGPMAAPMAVAEPQEVTAPAPAPRLTPVDFNPFPEDPLTDSEAAVRARMDAVGAKIDAKKKRSATEEVFAIFGEGANATVGMLGDLYGLATGDMDNALSRQAESGREYWKARQSPELQAAEAERKAKVDAAQGEWAKLGTVIWETVKNPRLLGAEALRQAPNLVVGGAPGALAARAGAGVAAATAAGVGTGAAMQGADVGGDAYDALMALPDEAWDQNQQYQALRQYGMKAEAAKKRLALSLAQDSAAAGAVVSLLSQALPGAQTLEKVMAGGKVTGGIVGRTLKGAAGEAMQEGIEEGGGAAARNFSVQNIDPDQALTEGVGEAAGLGAISAGPMGAVAGAASPDMRAQTDTEAGDEPSVSDLIGEDVEPQVDPNAMQPESAGPYDGRELPPTPITDASSPAVRGQVEDLPVEEVELAPAPPPTAIQAAVEELQAELAARPPAANVDVEEQALPVEDIEAAPPPAEPAPPPDVPAANIDVTDYGVDEIDAAPPPPGPPLALPAPTMVVDREGNAETETARQQRLAAVKAQAQALERDGRPEEALALRREAAGYQQEMGENAKAAAARASRLPPNWTDPRLARAPHRFHLRAMADDLLQGGGIAYKQDENGTITGRTPSLNPDWFKGMNEADETKMSVVATRLAVQKALAGEKLGVREARVIAGMLDEITGQRRDQVEYVKQELEKARRFRKTAAEAIGITDADVEQAGELFAEREYPADWDGPTRTLFELADEARAANAAEAQAILESGADNATVARRLLGVIHGRANTDVQGGPRQAEGEREAEAPTQAQGAQADAPAASDEAVAPPPASRSSEASAAQPPSVSLNSASTAASPPAVRAKSKPAPTVSPPAAQKPAKPAEPTADEQPAGARGARAQPEANTEKLIPGAQHRDAGSHAAQKASQGVPLSAKELSNIVRTESFIEKLDDLLKVPLDSEAGRPATNRIDSGSAPTKSLLNGVRTHAQSLRNILGGKSFSDQPFSSRDAKAQRLVLSNVFRLGHDSKVLGSVVKFIPVDVMDYLNGQKLSPKMVFHNRSVLKDALSIGFGSNVTAPRDLADSLVRAIALAGAEVSSGRVISDLEGPSKKLDAATGTLDNRHGVTPDSDAVLGAGDVGASSAPPTISESDSVETKDTDSGVMMFARMDEVETENGPAFDGEDIALFPMGKVPGSTDRFKYTVVDSAGNSTMLGVVTLGIKDGQVTRLHNIVVPEGQREKGVGTRILRSILDTSGGSIEIRDIADSALKFWKKVGTHDIVETERSRHGTLTRDAYERAIGAGGRGREADEGTGRQAGADPARGSGTPRPQATRREVKKAPERGLSVSEVRAYLEAKVGKAAVKRLLDSGRFKILPSNSAEVPAGARRAMESGMKVFGFTMPDGTTYLIADNLNTEGRSTPDSEDVYAIFLHEVGVHFGMREILGDELFEQLIQEVADVAFSEKPGALADAARAALKKVPRVTRADHVDEEVLAWLVTDRANHSLPLVKRIIAKIQAFLVRMGFTKFVGPDALVELARGAAQRAADEKGGETRFAREDVTDTPAFRRWFGDSKVVDQQGKPLVVYHGTTGDLSYFDLGFSGSDGVAYDRPAIFSTSDAAAASDYARNKLNRNIAAAGREFQRYKNENPGKYDEEYERLFEAYKRAGRKEGWDNGTGANVLPLYLSIQNPLVVDGGGSRFMQVMPDAVRRASDEKRDGVIVRNVIDHASPASEYPITVYVAFNPEQIKSATGNQGTFDPTNPDIRFARDDDSPVSRLLRRQKPAPLTPDAVKNRALREGDTDIRTRAKRFLRRQLAPGGLLPEPVFKAKIERDNKMEVVEFDTKNLVAQLEAAIKASYGKDARALNVATTEKLAAVLAGKSDPSIPDRVRVRLEAMRTYIDGLSKHYLAALHDDIKAMQAQAAAAGRATDGDAIRAKIDLFETIAGNIGQYVHRSYRAFDDPKWFKAVPDAVVSRARQYLTDRHVAKGETPAEAARLAEVAIHEILKTGTAYDSMEAFIKESKLGAKDLSVLKKREDIAPEIRALLGEYVDPRINFAKSTAKMSRLVFNHLFLKKVREVGMGTFLFEGTDRPPNATKQMAGDATEAYAPLNGLWTFPDVEQAFRDALGREQMANWYRHIVQVNGAVKFGKAQPLDAAVYTPTGPVRMGELAVGDEVCGINGRTKVTGIFPQGEMAVYRITFSDGSATEATAEHLWEVIGLEKCYTGVFTTEQIIGFKPNVLKKAQIAIPVGRADFDAQPVPVDPYLLGALLGDGCLLGSALRFSTGDDEMLAFIRESLPSGHKIERPPSWAKCDYTITAATRSEAKKNGNKVTSALRVLGVWNHLSSEKFIPDVYKYNSAAVRMAVVQGLLDTDGWVLAQDGQPEFSTGSLKLANDFIEVAESLGATALLRHKVTASGRDGYEVRLRVENAADWFRLTRKKSKAKVRKKPVKRTFKSIELIGRKDCQCIMVDDPRHLYLTDRFIATHNTVLSPTTAMRNFQSAMLFAVANGHFDMRHMAKSIAAAREYFRGHGDAKRTAYLRKMKQLGVVYDAPYAGEMMRLLEDSQAADWLASGKTATTIKQGLDFARKFYSYGDDFWKIIGFENEKRALMDAGMKAAEAETEAAERIRNTYPTYSMVGRAVNSLRRFPLVGTFVSFPAEIIRTSYHMLRYVAADWKHPKRRGLAVRRAVGLAVAAGFAQAIQVLTMSMFGVDDDEEEAVRDLAAPWGRNSNFAFAGRDENGDLRYFDLSFLDPYNYWKRPLIAITRDEPWEDKFKEIARETLTPFFGTDILAGTVFEIMANKTENGRPVYKTNDELANQAVDVIDHLRKAVQPGLVSNLERAFKAAEGEVSPSGRKFTAEDELAAWVGWRATTVNPRAALYYRSWEFKDAKGEAAQILRETLNNPNEVDDDDLEDATSTAQKRWEAAYKDFSRVIHAARKAGLTDGQIRSVLLNSRVPAKDIHALMKGEAPPMQLSAQSQKGTMKKVDVLFDAETKGEIRERYNEARRMLREAAD